MQPQQPEAAPQPEAASQPQSADALVASIRALVGSLPGATGIGAAAVFTNSTPGGAPRGRVQQVLALADDFTTAKLTTWDRTRKVAELAADPSVTLFWHNTGGDMGWVSASGTAAMEDVSEMTDKAGSPYGGVNFVVSIDRLECLNYSPEIMADTNREGWIPVALARDASSADAAWRLQALEDYGYDSAVASPVRSAKGVAPAAAAPAAAAPAAACQ